MTSRIQKTIINARVNLIFYFLILILSFYSRKIFLDNLGVEFIGLTSTLGNLLGFLNLAELGISTAIAYVLYKPLSNNNENQINEIISVLGYMYHRIGLFILGAGIVLSFFLPAIFQKADYSLYVIYFAYYSFLASSLIGYFANYKQSLLGADQRNYVVTKYFQTCNIIKLLIQMGVAYKSSNPYYWIIIELFFGVIYSVILNTRIKQTYPWLKSDIRSGKSILKKYPEITTSVKQLFVHKISFFVQSQTTPFLIYAFVSLKIVAFYGNYMSVIQKAHLLVDAVLGSTYASVGNLIASEDKNQIKKIFHELTAIRFFIAGLFAFLIFHFVESFISLWLGSEYVLGQTFLVLILIDLFISQYRGATDQFLSGYGLFKDTWAPIAEASIFFTTAIIGGYIWQLNGVLLGSILSKFIIVGIWKPYFLYHEGFKESVVKYWLIWLRHMGVFITSATLSTLILHMISINSYASFVNWICKALIATFIYATINSFLMYVFTPGTNDFIHRVVKLIERKIKR